jgi:L-asparaginase II
LARLLGKGDTLAEQLRNAANPRLQNWNRIIVGHISPAGELAAD